MNEQEIKYIRIPGPMRVVWASVGSYWISSILHSGFFSIAVTFLILIPVLLYEQLYPKPIEKISTKNSV